MELPFGIGNLTHLEAIEDEFSASVTPRDSGFPSDAFHFLGLPLDVRKKIYAIVLAVPVLICPRQRKTPVSDPYPISLNTVFHFYHFSFSNARVLRVNKQVHDEAKAVLYGENMFEIANLTSETIPKANFKISLFPRQYQDLIRTLTIKGRAMYAFRWILIKGHKELIKAYPALQSLDLIFEMENTQKGFAKKWARKEGEEWRPFIFRLRNALSQELYDCTGLVTCVPLWVNLRAVFAFERYDEAIDLELDQNFLDHVDKNNEEKVRQVELKRGMAEAFELFKRGFHP
ncbi:hypothetical protein BDV96DRAFT_491095 [Lophiotrema nucula]|uniref:Uncharacterized protein n=1 Tax=Lophiotrema nucula TaxID=690887 RepID=A0A6A5ZCC8_9PLEO|nr:hypothetical protein BDV96DRAFT_491095 [Lophiotrema nucula]